MENLQQGCVAGGEEKISGVLRGRSGGGVDVGGIRQCQDPIPSSFPSCAIISPQTMPTLKLV